MSFFMALLLFFVPLVLTMYLFKTDEKQGWAVAGLVVCFLGSAFWVFTSEASFAEASAGWKSITGSITHPIEFVFTSLIFGFVSYAAVRLIKRRFSEFPADHEQMLLWIAVLLPCLAVGVLLLVSEQVQKIVQEAGRPQLILAGGVLSLGCLVLWPMSGKHHTAPFFQTLQLTFIPCFCWYARLAHSVELLLIASFALAASVVGMIVANIGSAFRKENGDMLPASDNESS